MPSLFQCLSDSSTQAIWQLLPIEGRANTWGDEIYFEIPVQVGAEPDDAPLRVARAESAS